VETVCYRSGGVVVNVQLKKAPKGLEDSFIGIACRRHWRYNSFHVIRQAIQERGVLFEDDSYIPAQLPLVRHAIHRVNGQNLLLRRMPVERLARAEERRRLQETRNRATYRVGIGALPRTAQRRL
jgi:hypothetical protein